MAIAGTHHVPGMSEEQARRAARLEVPVLVAVLLTVPVLVLHSMDLPAWADTTVEVLNWAIWLAFVAEALVMIRLSPDDRAWLSNNKLDVAIILLTPPFLPDALQVLWVLRLLRILDLMPVVGRAFQVTGLRYAATVAFVAAVGGGLAYAELEDGPEGVADGFDGIYWAVTTITTVGYGDITPQTVAGKLLAEAMMLTGPVLIGLVSASVGSLIEQRFQREAAVASRRLAAEVDDTRDAVERLTDAERAEDAAEREFERRVAAALGGLDAELARLHRRLDAAGVAALPMEDLKR